MKTILFALVLLAKSVLLIPDHVELKQFSSATVNPKRFTRELESKFNAVVSHTALYTCEYRQMELVLPDGYTTKQPQPESVRQQLLSTHYPQDTLDPPTYHV